MSLLQPNYSDLALVESDIADEHHELDALPPRPNSRLGFNGAPVAPARSHKATLKWTRSLFQKIRIPSFPSADVDMDITAVSPDDDLDPLSLPALPSTSSLNLSAVDSCDDEYDSDSDDSSGDSDVDPDSPTLLFPPIPPTTPPSSPLPAVPPAPIALVPYAVPPPPPCPRRATPSPSRTKYYSYSALPSPLSPTADSDAYTNTNPHPHRHAYGHHGRSRCALLHFKYLWALREDTWDAHVNSYAYTGISSSPRNTAAIPRNHGHPPPPPPLPPLTIHPRRGDLRALRDPYPAHMDRCFAALPLWTLGKTLWMYDVHVGAAHRARMALVLELDDKDKDKDRESEDEERETGDGDDEDSEGESMAASVSTAGFSDDSDETLVESESESGGERDGESDGGMEEIDLRDGAAKQEGVVKEGAFRTRSEYLAPPSASLPPPQWETCAYKRWEILLELMRIDTARAPPAPTPTSSAARPRFFIGDGEDELDEGEGDDPWGEERWEERWEEVLAGHGGEDDVMIVSSSEHPILRTARR
ncbi:hypothetical protein C8R47DRAFT_1221382 [Mycena vitilis]|nr:hypothetical protein C8R47DRAFT_1221382 [Mycena vitilis]